MPGANLPAVSPIYILDAEPAEAAYFQAALAGQGEVRCVARPSQVGLAAEVVSGFIHTPVDAAFLGAHPALRLVATRSTAVEHIDLPACRARGVAIARVPFHGGHTVAEHTVALLLALTRRLREVTSETAREGRLSYAANRATELRGKTLGVLGAGRIGRHVIAVAQAFGMHVLAYDLRPPRADAAAAGFGFAPLAQVLAASHILTLHLPLLPETRHLLNRDTLALCRPGVFIVNTARGALIDTDALIDALDSGQVAGAALDVLEEEGTARQEMTRLISDQIIGRLHAVTNPAEITEREPNRVRELQNLLRNKRLTARPNVIFTPHVAFNSVEAVERINAVTVENILGFLNGQPANLVG